MTSLGASSITWRPGTDLNRLALDGGQAQEGLFRQDSRGAAPGPNSAALPNSSRAQTNSALKVITFCRTMLRTSQAALQQLSPGDDGRSGGPSTTSGNTELGLLHDTRKSALHCSCQSHAPSSARSLLITSFPCRR